MKKLVSIVLNIDTELQNDQLQAGIQEELKANGINNFEHLTVESVEVKDKPEFEPIEWTRIDNDTNGNPRYVCHFLNFIKSEENISIGNKYAIALARARKLGGRKFNNKQYGGGIVFQSYNIKEDERRINELMKKY